jgi:3-phenylpropionate/trans-cinnamate dioxygenase ferredoxin reductase component
MSPAPFVIVGGGLTGAKTAESLRGWGYDGQILLVAEEPQRPYERPPLSKSFLRGQSDFEDAAVHPDSWYVDHDVELLTSTRALSIDPAQRLVELDPGGGFLYSRLVLATGSRPRPLEVPGTDLDGVFYLRSMADAEAVRSVAIPGSRAVIIGAGWVGTEVSASLRRLGVEVALVYRSPTPFHGILGPEFGTVMASLHAEHGVELHPGSSVRALTGTSSVEQVELHSGTVIECDFVVVGLGVNPADELARQAGIDIDNGVLTEASLATSAPGVFAAGDVANVDHPIFGRRVRSGHWWTALTQPPVAAASMLGHPARYDWVPTFTSKQYDLMIEHTGFAPVWDSVVFRGDPASRCFMAFWLAAGLVAAGATAGIPGLERHMRKLVTHRAVVLAASLADPDVDLADLADAASQRNED